MVTRKSNNMSILSNVDWQKQGSEAFTYLKGLGNKVKQMALQLTEVEIKVEDATNNQPWGPHGKDMAGKIALHWGFSMHTSTYHNCPTSNA